MNAPTANPSPPSLPLNVDNATETARVMGEFVKPFPPVDVKLKPQMVKNNRALAISYVDARAVMDRLDAVVHADGWQDAYTVLGNGNVECRLSVWIAGKWITKADVGSPSEQPDEGDRMKAAYSDAFKRAAVKFGIGRYLYRLPSQWMDYDPVKKQILRPGNQAPAPKPEPKPAPAPARASENPKPAPAGNAQPSESAREIVAAFDAAKSREDGAEPYKRYEAAQNAGKVNAVDKACIDAALARFAQRFPKQPAQAK